MLKHKERIGLKDNFMTAIMNMAGGNPRAITAICSLAKASPVIDPMCIWGPLGPLLAFDTLGIYEDRIWMLFKDNCKQDITKTLTVLRAHQMGIITRNEIENATTYQGRVLISEERIKEAYIKLKEVLPEFDPDGTFNC